MSQQIWSVNSLGGFLASDTLSKKVRHAAQPLMKFRQFVDPEPAMGKSTGDTVLFDKISNISTGGGTLSETNTIPKRNYSIKQGSLTVKEYGNGVPFTLKSEVLAEVSVPDNIKTVLRNDEAKTLDSAAVVEFQSTEWKAVCDATDTTVFSTNGTAGTAAGNDMSDKNVRDIVDQLKQNSVPRYDGNNFICIASTNAIRGLYDFFEQKIQNTDEVIEKMFNGEIGMYYGCRFIEETHVLNNALNSGSGSEAIFFGEDAVREGLVVPEEIRIDLPKDFGRDQGIAWYYLGGFKKVWDYSTDSESRIIHVTST